MPRYFFDVTDGDGVFMDDEGAVCETVKDVEREAFLTLTEMARDAIRAGSNEDITVVVRAETGPVLQAKLKLEISRLN